MKLKSLISTVLPCLMLLISPKLYAEEINDIYEQSLIQAVSDIQQLNHQQALDDTRKLLEQYPTSKVGQMLYADLLLAKAGVLPSIGYGMQQQSQRDDLTLEIKQRLSSQQTPADQGLLPDSLLQLADNQPFYLLLDQSQSRLYVYRNEQGKPILEADYFLSIGLKGSGKEKRGDQKTPIGVYHVTQYIDDEALPDLYGKGAFPVNYPNSWDKRHRRTGDGIWLHGTPSYTYNRAPLSSNGCMVVSNPDFINLKKYISPEMNTPVIVVKDIRWIHEDEWMAQQQQMNLLLTQWIKDWENKNHADYISHYSTTEFNARGRNYRQWSDYKRRVNAAKTFIDVDVSNLSIYRYPGEEELILMQFEQAYSSNNLSVESPKELYWKKQSNGWKIVSEDSRKVQLRKTLATN